MNDNLFNPDDYVREEYKNAKPYRPYSSCEGESFMEEFCYNCQKDDEDEEIYCDILFRSISCDINHENYPKEWIIGTNGPVCTAYKGR